MLANSTSGATKFLHSNSTSAETTRADSVSSFDSDGFSLGDYDDVNNGTGTYVAWCFLKDAEAFDIVGYTGTGSATTVAHNMSVAPEMIIVKKRSGAGTEWRTYHKDLNAGTTPEDFHVELNNTGAEAASGSWNSAAPTSSVFSIDGNDTNAGSATYISYLYASKAGVSKVGSYSGTGSSGNAITGLGFTPRFVMIKDRTATTNWVIYDSARGDGKELEPNVVDVEGTLAVTLDSDGFTLNNTDGRTNTSGTDNYIYLALA